MFLKAIHDRSPVGFDVFAKLRNVLGTGVLFRGGCIVTKNQAHAEEAGYQGCKIKPNNLFQFSLLRIFSFNRMPIL
jgi:hypothetical protein